MIYHEGPRTRWCPRCGAEYREGFTECADCGVALVSTPPRPRDDERDERDQPASSGADGDHRQPVEYDLSGWTTEQRSLLDFILNGDRIPYRLDDDILVVPHVYDAKVADIIDSIEGEELSSPEGQ